MRSIPLRLWVFSLVSALLQLLPFPLAGPAPLWRRVFCWFCLVPLLYALLSPDRRGRLLRPIQTAMVGYVCGVIWYMGNCYWIYRTMHIYENIPAAASFGILFLFALYVGLYHALFGALVGLLHIKFSRFAVLCAVPFLWVAVELARANITSFPWDLLGYTQVDNLTLTRMATWTGVMGLSFVVAAVNALWLIRVPMRSRGAGYFAIGAAAVLVVAFTFLAAEKYPRAASPTQAVATLVQENLGVGIAADHETKQELLSSFDGLSLKPSVPLAGSPHSTIIAWPEAPAPFIGSDMEFRDSMGKLAQTANAPVIVNAITYGPQTADGHYNLYNSAAFFLADGSYAGRYDKMHLVPFGEYTPYKPLFFFVGHLLDDLVFIPGESRRLLDAGGKHYGVFICYESIFGDDMRQFARLGAQVLVNISDDGWYGDTSAPWEHLDMVRMRAIENRRWIVRATNTGITAAIDPLGRVTATYPRHLRGSMQVAFGYRDDMTFYTRHGDWFGWLCAWVTLGMIGFGYFRHYAGGRINGELPRRGAVN
jgi:apolipoprotein N-acyltransferase